MEILMLVGSETGNAEMVGDCLKDELEGRGHTVELLCEASLADLRLENQKTLLVVTSTTGLGDVPQNIEQAWEELVEQRPQLGHLRFGIIGLGDRNYYDSFCGGSEKWGKILNELGATQIGQTLQLDATDNPMPDEDAVAWIPSWLSLCE